MHKLPFPLDHQSLEVIVGIATFIARGSVSHFEINNISVGFVDQPMSVPGARFEAGTHTWRQPGPTFVGVERRVTL